MEQIAAGADKPEHAIQLPETVESDSLPQGSQNQNFSPGQYTEQFFFTQLAPLCIAAAKGNWERAQRLFEENPELVSTAITEKGDTALHVATKREQVDFVRRLIGIMPKEALATKDRNGNTPLGTAAAAGCVEIARILLQKSPDLLAIKGPEGLTPLNMAVLLGKSDMTMVLYDVATNSSPLTPEDEERLVFDSNTNDLYDVALKLLKRRSDLASTCYNGGKDDRPKVPALHLLARKPYIFGQKVKFNMSRSALQLLNCLLDLLRPENKIETLIKEHSNLLWDAARLGNSRFLAELIRSYPHLIYELDEKGRTIFHIAILHRQFSVFNLIYEMDFNKEIIVTYVDYQGNSMLHLAATYLLDQSPESTWSSAALEMQQE